MNGIVKFAIIVMAFLMLALGVLIYFSSGIGVGSTEEKERQSRIERFFNRQGGTRNDIEVVTFGSEIRFEGEAGAYRSLQTRRRSAGPKAPVMDIVMLVTADGTPVQLWTHEEFIKSKRADAADESTVELQSWKRKKWNDLIEQLGMKGSIGDLPPPPPAKVESKPAAPPASTPAVPAPPSQSAPAVPAPPSQSAPASPTSPAEPAPPAATPPTGTPPATPKPQEPADTKP